MTEIDRFRHRFLSAMHRELAETGQRPTVCIADRMSYAMLEFMASEECTVDVDDIQVCYGHSGIIYLGVEVFCSGVSTGLSFGYVPSKQPIHYPCQKLT